MSDPGGRGAPGGGSETGAPELGEAPGVIVALDFPSADEAMATVRRLPAGTWYKVGLELFTAEGPGFVERLAGPGHPVFLDLKLHDIPNTVAGATRSAARLGARLLTVHASGGAGMIAAAADAARSASGPPEEGGLAVLAVTVLTSLDDEGLGDVMGEGARVEEAVGRLAALAGGAGAAGAVASVEECAAIKAICGPGFRVATPGIRLPGGDAHDQVRVATPAEARRAGADWMVVGRTITRADDPAAALRRVREAARG